MDQTTREQLKHVHGRSLDPVTGESEHFYVCAACGQAVDMRSLYQLFHHEEEGHNPRAQPSCQRRRCEAMIKPNCNRCDGTGWVCENHRDRPWGDMSQTQGRV